MLTKRQEFPIQSKLLLPPISPSTVQSNLGGRVVTLNGEDKEAICMIQSFYSRSPNPIEFHLEKVAKMGTAGFMSKWYIGYGHDSIGDSANDTLFIEGIADNEAEDFQNHPLMRLQRASTRMMDFSTVSFILPATCNSQHQKYVESLRTFYLEAGPILEKHLLQKNNIQLELMTVPEQREMMANIRAAKFDILRGFLPAGVATNLSCNLSLRSFKDHLLQLRNFPNPRIQEIAANVYTALKEKHPNSFPDFNRQTLEQTTWQQVFYSNEILLTPDLNKKPIAIINSEQDNESIQVFSRGNLDLIPPSFRELLQTRPERVQVPKEFNRYGQFSFEFKIDQGSARDLKRHNAIQKKSSRLSDEFGFEPWYLEQLPEDLRKRAKECILIPEELKHGLAPTDIEYFTPMGYRLSFQFSGGLADLIYLLEIRCNDKVHPTLRKHLCKIAQYFQKEYPDIKLYANTEPSSFNFERGKQTITEKPPVSEK